jgi:hypothetical protein
VEILRSLAASWSFRTRQRAFVAVVVLVAALVVTFLVLQPETKPGGLSNNLVPTPAPVVRGTVVTDQHVPIPGPSVADQDEP